jgi:hypothetical protein
VNVSATTATAAIGATCWTIIVVSTGILAHRRGRLVRSWVASAIFFGFFALLVLSTLPPLERNRVTPDAPLGGLADAGAITQTQAGEGLG